MSQRPAGLFLLILSFWCFPVFSQAPGTDTEPRPPREQEVRDNDRPFPVVALVLAGGSALGIAHAGVLQVLEEHGIPIDIVVGTSMGAILGGFYVAGYSPYEIREIAGSIDWRLMFSDAVPRTFYSLRDREIDSRYFLQAGIDREGVRIGGGLLRGQNITTLLEQLTVRIPDDIEFDELSPRYRAVAADILTGEEVVFSAGSLSEAMRASMNLPGVFAPYAYQDRWLVDGGIVNNMPVDIARSLDADIVIAVEIYSPLIDDINILTASPIRSVTQSTQLLGDLRMQRQRELADLVITPDLTGLSVVEFARSDEIIDRGERAARDTSHRLDELAQEIAQTRPLKYREGRTGRYSDELVDPVITNLRVTGGTPEQREQVSKVFAGMIGVTLSPERLAASVDRVYGSGNYDLVKTRVVEFPDPVLEVELVPRTGRADLVALGMAYTGMLSDNTYTRMDFTPAVLYRDISGLGSFWLIELTIGNTLQAVTRYFQPLGNHLFVSPYGRGTRDYDVYAGTQELAYYYQKREYSGGLEFGVWVGRFGRIAAAYEAGFIESFLIEDEKENAETSGAIVLRAVLDSLNSVTFPVRGGRFSTEYTVASPSLGGTAEYYKIKGDLRVHLPVTNSVSLGAGLSAGTDFSTEQAGSPSLKPHNAFRLADNDIFVAYNNEPAFGSHKIAIGGSLQVRVGTLSEYLRSNVYFVLHGGVGNIWEGRPDPAVQDSLRRTVAAGFGLDWSEAFMVFLRAGFAEQMQPFVALNFGRR